MATGNETPVQALMKKISESSQSVEKQILIHSKDLGFTFDSVKVTKVASVEREGIRKDDVLVKIGDIPLDAGADNHTVQAAINESRKDDGPLSIMVKREAASFTVECIRKKMKGSLFAKSWIKTILALEDNKLSRYKNEKSKKAKQEMGITFDTSIEEINKGVGDAPDHKDYDKSKPHSFHLVGGHGLDLGTFCFSDNDTRGKVILRIQEVIDQMHQTTEKEMKSAKEFRDGLKKKEVVDALSDGIWKHGVIEEITGDGDSRQFRVALTTGEELLDLDIFSLRQTPRNTTAKQVKEMHTAAVERSSPAKSKMSRKKSFKKEQQKIPMIARGKAKKN